MAKARMYSVNTSAVKTSDLAKLKGQAKIVMDELLQNETPRLATEINAETEKCLKTRQDTLRVTLYYILVFKSKGWILTAEVPQNETLETQETE